MGFIWRLNIFWISFLGSSNWFERGQAYSFKEGSPLYHEPSALFSFPPNSRIDEETWVDDEYWWEGAEEIDLTLSPFEYEEDDLQDETSNKTCSLQIDSCDSVMPFFPPSLALDLLPPPPPLPPFLSGFEGVLQDSDDRWGSLLQEERSILAEGESELFGGSLMWKEFEKEECTLCRWASGGNMTLYMFPRLRDEEDIGVSQSTAGMLVGVALVSAVIGAAIMGILLRCRKKRNQTANEGETCSLRTWREWRKSRATKDPPIEIPTSSTEPNKAAPIPSSSKIKWPLKMLLPKATPQAKLNSPTSPENSYSEEPYVNADASSALYAELSAPSSIPLTETCKQAIPPNAYSEIPDPAQPAEVGACLKGCDHRGTYENAGYSVSESPSEHNESSPCSTSTPSSAYYSDASALQFHNSKKKKKKRKGDERNNTCKFSSPSVVRSSLPTNVPVICSHVPLHLNMAPVQTQYFPIQDTVPVRVTLVPSHTRLNGRELDLGVPSLLYHTQGLVQNIDELNNLSNTRPIPGNVRNCCDHNFCKDRPIQQDKLCVHNIQNAANAQRMQNIPSVRNNNAQCQEMVLRSLCQESHRPLPPLPSQLFLHPQKSNVKTSFDQNMSEFPSEYV